MVLGNQINTQTVFTFPDIVVYGSTTVRKCNTILVILLTLNGYYIFGHIGVICLKSSNCTLKQSKTNSPLPR